MTVGGTVATGALVGNVLGMIEAVCVALGNLVGVKISKVLVDVLSGAGGLVEAAPGPHAPRTRTVTRHRVTSERIEAK